MGREIRKVPGNWQHPRNNGRFVPLHDKSFDEAIREWIRDGHVWLAGWRLTGGDRDRVRHGEPCTWAAYAEWDGAPPDPETYRPAWTDAERTHLQLYETVSEGTPISPPLPTPEALVDWLVANPDPVHGGWARADAERFVAAGWAPSFIMNVSEAGAEVLPGYKILEE